MSRSPMSSPKKTRGLKWLRRLFRRFRYKQKFPDEEAVQGRVLVQGNHPVLPHILGGVNPASTSSHHCTDNSNPLSDLPPGSVISYSDMCTCNHGDNTRKDSKNIKSNKFKNPLRRTQMSSDFDDEVVTTCLPSLKSRINSDSYQKHVNVYSPAPSPHITPQKHRHTYGYSETHSDPVKKSCASHQRSPADGIESPSPPSEDQAAADAAYMNLLRQQFTTKYQHFIQGASPEVEPQPVLNLEDCLRNPPQLLHDPDSDLYSWPDQVQQTDCHNPDISSIRDTKRSSGCRESVQFDVKCDNESVNSWRPIDTSKKYRRHKQRRRTRMRNFMHRKLLKPKHYSKLKEAEEDMAEIEQLEEDFNQKQQNKSINYSLSPSKKKRGKGWSKKASRGCDKTCPGQSDGTTAGAGLQQGLSEFCQDGISRVVDGMAMVRLNVGGSATPYQEMQPVWIAQWS